MDLLTISKRGLWLLSGKQELISKEIMNELGNAKLTAFPFKSNKQKNQKKILTGKRLTNRLI